MGRHGGSGGSPLDDGEQQQQQQANAIIQCSGAHSTSTSSNSTRNAVDLINEYLTMVKTFGGQGEMCQFGALKGNRFF
jgi:hypothetical protein